MAPDAPNPPPKRPRWYSRRRMRKMSRDEMDAYLANHAGEYIAIPLDGGFSFARHRGDLDFAHYDLWTPELVPIAEIRRRPILFTIIGPIDPLASRRWKVIGHEPLEPYLQEPVKYFRHPRGTDFLDIYVAGEFRPYAGEDLDRLEPVAIWDRADQVEERLRKHYAGERDEFAERDKVPRELAERLYREYWARHEKGQH